MARRACRKVVGPLDPLDRLWGVHRPQFLSATNESGAPLMQRRGRGWGASWPHMRLAYNPVAMTDVTGGMSHGKSLPDVWNDSVVNVAATSLAQKQKMFSALDAGTLTLSP